jgi:hypothetical protein
MRIVACIHTIPVCIMACAVAILLSVAVCAQTIALMGFVEQYANSKRDIGLSSKHGIGIGYGTPPLVDGWPLTYLFRYVV